MRMAYWKQQWTEKSQNRASVRTVLMNLVGDRHATALDAFVLSGLGTQNRGSHVVS